MKQLPYCNRAYLWWNSRAVGSWLCTLWLVVGLITIAVTGLSTPVLRITGSNDTVTLNWPLWAHYFVLESATNTQLPPPPGPWVNAWTSTKTLADTPGVTPHLGVPRLVTNYASGEFSVNVPATNTVEFFRLEPASFIPVTKFAVFYDGLLEFTYATSLKFLAAVHANGKIYSGSPSIYTFTDTVTCTGDISSQPNDGVTNAWAHNGVYNGIPPSITNIAALKIPMDTTNLHDLIEIPSSPPHITNIIWQPRLYHTAQVIILVSNTSVSLRVQTSPSATLLPGNDPSPIIRNFTNLPSISHATNLPFLQLTNTFYDQREGKTNLVADIDVYQYRHWVATNVFVQSKVTQPTILYIANNRTYAVSQLPVVRLRNGANLPANNGLGFTVATRNPLYVWGHYNQTNAAYLGTTNTSSGTVPAALISDALTILSGNWSDTNSFFNKFTPDNRNAVDTTINAAIVTGSMPSTGNTATTFSGGVHNLPRLLEDWLHLNDGGPPSSSRLTLNTSLIRLFTSTMATNQFRNPLNFGQPNPYYDPPSRQFSYDQSFFDLSKQPPGIPIVMVTLPAN